MVKNIGQDERVERWIQATTMVRVDIRWWFTLLSSAYKPHRLHTSRATLPLTKKSHASLPLWTIVSVTTRQGEEKNDRGKPCWEVEQDERS